MKTIVAYRYAESLLTPPEPWNALAGGIPFRETAWLQSWWNQFGGQGEFLFVTVLDENDALCGILPLQRSGPRGWQTIAGGTVCTDHVSLLVRAEDRDLVAEVIADFLIENAIDPLLGWDRLTFEGTPAGDPAMQALLDQLRQRDAAIRLTTRVNIWFIPCRDDWETYLLSCSRRARRRYREMIKQIGEADAADGTGVASELAIRISDDVTSVTATLEKLIEMHQRHWQAQNEPGSYAQPGMKEFVHRAAIESLHRGRLFMPALVRCCPQTQTEQIIAAQLLFIGDDGRLYCYSTGVDYDYAALSPGSLLNTFVLKYAHDNGCLGIDFLRGDEEYKQRLGAEPIPMLRMDVSAPTLRGRLAAWMDDWKFRGKQCVRRRLRKTLIRTLTFDEAFDPRYREHLPESIEADEQRDDERYVFDGQEPPVLLPISLAFAHQFLR